MKLIEKIWWFGLVGWFFVCSVMPATDACVTIGVALLGMVLLSGAVVLVDYTIAKNK